jgi:hypothetical protein
MPGAFGESSFVRNQAPKGRSTTALGIARCNKEKQMLNIKTRSNTPSEMIPALPDLQSGSKSHGFAIHYCLEL